MTVNTVHNIETELFRIHLVMCLSEVSHADFLPDRYNMFNVFFYPVNCLLNLTQLQLKSENQFELYKKRILLKINTALHRIQTLVHQDESFM